MFFVFDTPSAVWTKPVVPEHRIHESTWDEVRSVNEFVRTWDAARIMFADVAGLQDNWDGDGANAPKTDILGSVSIFLFDRQSRGQSAPTRVTPTTDGTVVLEWLDESGFRATFEFSGPAYGEWLIERPGYPAEFREERIQPSARRTTVLTDELVSV